MTEIDAPGLKGRDGVRYIGVDLAWKMRPTPTERRSAVAALDETARLIYYKECTTDAEIVDSVDKLASVGCVIGIDAPLIVPDGTKGRRECEGMLMEMEIHIYPTDPKRFEEWYGGCRGVVLVELLKQGDRGYQMVDHLPATTNKAVVETYPTGAWKRLFGEVPKFKGVPSILKRDALFMLKEMLKSRLPPGYPAVKLEELDLARKDMESLTPLGLDIYGDALDAVMSAYTVLLWARDPSKCEVVGDLERGFVLLPRAPGARAR